MSVPIPAPRFTNCEAKKPIPLPRRTKSSINNKPEEELNDNISMNSLSRRVRSLSNASKQIAEDIGELVHDKKKAVIEGTRQSMRRITKRFNNSNLQQCYGDECDPKDLYADNGKDMDMFNNISFQSPIHYARDSIYSNVEAETEEFSLPPPMHPPPPLPDDSIYDAPASSISGSGSTSNSEHSSLSLGPSTQAYESIFPVNINNNSDSDLSRSGSWKFYDSVVISKSNDEEEPGREIVIKEADEANNSDNDSSVNIRNSIYENHEIVSKTFRDLRGSRATESVIIQFDPLSSKSANNALDDKSNNNAATTSELDNIKMLEDYLQKDLYSNMSSVYTLDTWSISNDSEEEYTAPPPPPPLRFDSLPEEEQNANPSPPSQPCTPREKSKTHWFTANSPPPPPSSTPATEAASSESNKKFNWLKQVKGVLEKGGGGAKSKDSSIVQRPPLDSKTFIHKKGMLYKVQSGPVEDLFGEYSGRWCILQNTDFVCYSDSTCESVKERFPAANVLSIQIIQDSKFKYKYENEELHCFELNTTGKSRGGHIYGARDLPERRIWMQYICESLCRKFPTKLTSNYTRMGWAYLREGVSGKWTGAWLMLHKRKLYYAMDNHLLKSIDLRKARCILFQMHQEFDNNPKTNDKGPNIVLDSTSLTLYLRMWTGRETKVWCHMIKLAAYNNGANIEEQQLTKNDIPVLVEKCINFIYTHGSMSEGIYRKPGTGKNITDILVKFRKNAWEVQLTKDNYSEYDVGTALKRFFRDLPEPLLSSSRRHYLHNVSLLKDESERIRMYKAALEELPPIVLKTTKKLIGHLSFIASQHEKNLMNVDNLASIWGVTLMSSEEMNDSKHINDAIVLSHLINLYKDIFAQDTAEIEQEKRMLEYLQKHTSSPQAGISNTKSAGDLRVWIYINSKEGKSVNVAIGATKTAYEVCAELTDEINLKIDQVILEEVVLNNKLSRPIHHCEKVLDIVLRWSYWEEQDRKDNHLILIPITKYLEFNTTKLPEKTNWDDIKFADSKSRFFKSFSLKFAQAKLFCYKDKMYENVVNSWNIEDIKWYLGHEAKRSSPTRHTLTFFDSREHPKRTKLSPYFGNIIAFQTEKDRSSLLIGMVNTQYKSGLMPPPMHVNLLN